MIEQFMQNNIQGIIAIIRKIKDKEFDSHEFIRKFSEKYQRDYVLFLNQYQEEPFKKVHAQIGLFLAKAARDGVLQIQDLRRTTSPDIFGNDSPNELWMNNY